MTNRTNNKLTKGQKFRLAIKHIFFEHWPLKLGAIVVAVLLWLCIGYLL